MKNKKVELKNFEGSQIRDLIDIMFFMRDVLITECEENGQMPDDNQRILNLQDVTIKIFSGTAIENDDITFINQILDDCIKTFEKLIKEIKSGELESDNEVLNSLKINSNKTVFLKDLFNKCIKQTQQ